MDKKKLERRSIRYNIMSIIYGSIAFASFVFILGVVGREETDPSFSLLTGTFWIIIAIIIFAFSAYRCSVFCDTRNRINKWLSKK